MTRRAFFGALAAALMPMTVWRHVALTGNTGALWPHGAWLDFGRGNPVVLHGRERVMTEAEAAAMPATEELRALRRAFDDLPRLLVKAQRDARLLATKA